MKATFIELSRWTNEISNAIYVTLPLNWKSSNCLAGREMIMDDAVLNSEPSFVVEKQSFFSSPWAEQFGGCETKGKAVHLPLEFLAEKRNLKGKLFNYLIILSMNKKK